MRPHRIRKLRKILYEEQDGTCYWERDGSCLFKGKQMTLVPYEMGVVNGREKKIFDEIFASFDHLVPISLGGERNRKSNIVLAHAGCNWRRRHYLNPVSCRKAHGRCRKKLSEWAYEYEMWDYFSEATARKLKARKYEG